MHIFLDTVWKLHIGEIPEKCSIACHKGKIDECHNEDCALYNETIAAIKQNALIVGNPEIFLRDEWGYGKFIHMPDGSNHLIESDHFYFWPGGYEMKEIIPRSFVADGNPNRKLTQTVAILTLPEEKKHHEFRDHAGIPIIVSEEKKNTMENNEDDRRGWPEEEEPIKNNPPTKGYSTYTNPASGSAGNMTKEQQFNLPAAVVFNLQQIALADDDMVKAPGAAENYRFIARHILELFTASGSVAAPKEKTNIEDQFKIDNYKTVENRLLSANSDIKQLESENTALREALKELLPIAEWYTTEYPMDAEDLKAKAIIETARKLILK